MFEGLPYTNFHELNLDWIIKIAKDFLDQYTNIQQTITQGLEDLDTKAQQLEAALDAWYAEHSADIEQELAQAVAQATADFAIAANARAAEAIESIPGDYTELYDLVLAIKKAFPAVYIDSISEYDVLLTKIPGEAARGSDGEIIYNSSYARCDAVNVKGASAFRLTGVTEAFSYVTYDLAGKFVNSQIGSITDSGIVNISGNIGSIIFSFNNSNPISNYHLYLLNYDTPVKQVENNALMVAAAGIKGSQFPNNLINPFHFVDHAVVDYHDGKIGTSGYDNYFCTDYIPVEELTSYKANHGRNFAWYDEDHVFISGEQGTGIQSGRTSPAGAAYLRITVNKSSDGISNPMLLYLAKTDEFDASVSIPGLEAQTIWCYGKKINWIGDSIVDGPDFDEQVCAALGLVKDSEYGINGSTISLKGDGTNSRNAICARYNLMSDDADMIAVSAGTNDFMYAWAPIGSINDPDDGSSNTTFYGALKALCKGLINKYPQKLIFFTTPIKRGQAFDNGDGGTYTPDGVPTDPFSKNKYGKTLMDYSDIIKEVCGYYSIPVLDMNRESMLNPNLSSQAGLFDAELTHPNVTAQKIMARRVAGWLTQIGYNIP